MVGPQSSQLTDRAQGGSRQKPGEGQDRTETLALHRGVLLVHQPGSTAGGWCSAGLVSRPTVGSRKLRGEERSTAGNERVSPAFPRNTQGKGPGWHAFGDGTGPWHRGASGRSTRGRGRQLVPFVSAPPAPKGPGRRGPADPRSPAPGQKQSHCSAAQRPPRRARCASGQGVFPLLSGFAPGSKAAPLAAQNGPMKVRLGHQQALELFAFRHSVRLSHWRSFLNSATV